MKYTFKTPCHPEALGKKAKAGNNDWGVFFPTDDGGRVTVLMGRYGIVNHLACVLKMLEEDPALTAEVHDAMAEIEGTK